MRLVRFPPTALDKKWPHQVLGHRIVEMNGWGRDVASAPEATACDDAPVKKDGSPTTGVGKRPAMSITDRSFVSDRQFAWLLAKTAEDRESPYNTRRPASGRPVPVPSISQSRGTQRLPSL